MKKPSVAIVRGKFLNRYEMQFYEPLVRRFNITAFGSLTPFHDQFAFSVVKLPSPMDLPQFPYSMSVLNRIFIDAQYLWGLEKRLKGFDIVHTAETYYHYTQQCLNAKRRGDVKKVVATVLENIPYNNEGIMGRKAFKQRARTELDHMIALTERTKTAMVLEGADPEKITVISHFIDTTRFVPREGTSTTDPMKIEILFSGRLERYKGVYELLYAISLLQKDPQLTGYHICCTLVGDGSQKSSLLALEKQLGITPYITHTQVSYDDMPPLYQSADIYVAPSKASDTWIEQYNTTLLEAQACGLPIITTCSGGIPENVGDAAVLVQPDDVLSLVRAIKAFILSPHLREQYGHKARKRAEAVHDIAIGAQKLSALYDRLLS